MKRRLHAILPKMSSCWRITSSLWSRTHLTDHHLIYANTTGTGYRFQTNCCHRKTRRTVSDHRQTRPCRRLEHPTRISGIPCNPRRNLRRMHEAKSKYLATLSLAQPSTALVTPMMRRPRPYLYHLSRGGGPLRLPILLARARSHSELPQRRRPMQTCNGK